LKNEQKSTSDIILTSSVAKSTCWMCRKW